MSAEQAWDSLLTLVIDDIDSRIADPLGPRVDQIYKSYDFLANATDDEVLERAGRLALRYSNPEQFRKEQRAQRTRQQAEMRKKRQRARPLYKELGRARKAGDDEKVREISAKLRAMGLQPPGSRAGRAVRDLQRASDLPSPAPDGHLVRELGQSERELIDESHRDPTVPQVLALLNSFLEQKLLTNSSATLMRSIQSARGSKAKVKTAFVGVLGRTPTSEERSGWEREISRGGEQSVRDLVWTLVNSHEFLFIQ